MVRRAARRADPTDLVDPAVDRLESRRADPAVGRLEGHRADPAVDRPAVRLGAARVPAPAAAPSAAPAPAVVGPAAAAEGRTAADHMGGQAAAAGSRILPSVESDAGSLRVSRITPRGGSPADIPRRDQGAETGKCPTHTAADRAPWSRSGAIGRPRLVHALGLTRSELGVATVERIVHVVVDRVETRRRTRIPAHGAAARR